jgi:two-component system chemotaxis sensor kinase CheA
MGDGKVALILDVLGTAQRAHVVAEGRDRGIAEKIAQAADENVDEQSLVILEVGQRRLAMPIELVSRLEEIPRDAVEAAGQQEVVQYRGQIMPLLRIGALLGIAPEDAAEGPLQVVVYNADGQCYGLAVDRVADIVHTAAKVTRPSHSDDLLASAVIQDRVTDLLNLPAIIRRASGGRPEVSMEKA